jgi:hypothetical protein
MLAIGRALMARPDASCWTSRPLGRAPLLLHEIFDIIGRLNGTITGCRCCRRWLWWRSVTVHPRILRYGRHRQEDVI